MSELDRFRSYEQMLSTRRAMAKHEILSRLEISPATFKRDLVKLRDLHNMPVVFDRDLGGYRLEADAQLELPGLWFSQDELLALMTIQSMIEQLEPGILGPKLKPLQKRLDDMLKSQGLDAQMLTQRIRLVHAGKRRLPLKAFEAVAKATLDRRRLKIAHYARQTGETMSRVISPQQLVHYRDNWYVDAWCHWRKAFRSFSVDAITECQELKEQAKEFDPDLVRQSTQMGYGIFRGKVKDWAKLTFSPARARWVQHEEWHPDQVGTLNKDGSYTLEVPYADVRELVGDILRFGADVVVRSPAGLVKLVAEQFAAAINLYESKT